MLTQRDRSYYSYIWNGNEIYGVRQTIAHRGIITCNRKIEYLLDGSVRGYHPTIYADNPNVIEMLTPEAIAKAEKQRIEEYEGKD